MRASRKVLLLALMAGLFMPLAARAQASLAHEACLGCHGPGGAGAAAAPAIAGRDAAELRGLMSAFRANERPSTIMNRIVRGYTDEELAAVADYFARLKN